MKKIFAVMMALVMVLALSGMAFGVQTVGTESATTGTVTISNATIGETYQGFRIFNATVARSDNSTAADPSDDTSSGINYTWAGSGSMPTNAYFVEDASGNITATNLAGSGANNLSADAIALIKSWIDDPQITFPSTAATVSSDATMKFAGLDYGYWYFTSTLGAVVTIDSTNPNATVTDKNAKPTINKLVKEDGTGNFGKQNDAEYGQTVEFQTTINCTEGATNYRLYDKMDDAFTFDGINSITIVLNDSSNSSRNVPATETVSGQTVTNWTASTGGTYPDGTGTTTATFNIVFSEYLLNQLETGYKIIVDYTATLTDAAAINTAVLNDTILTFGNASKTAESETHTYTWGAKVVKYTGNDVSTGTKLSGAEFIIARHGSVDDGQGGTINGHYFATFDNNGKFTGWSTFCPESTIAEADIATTTTSADFQTAGATILITDGNGEINVNGLDEGSYHLIESKAPDGYNKLTSTRTLTLTTTGDYGQINTALTNGTNGVTEIDVQNNAGTVLPSTGGVGTTIFYIIGGLLIAAAVVVLITRKRMNRE